MFRHLLVPLDGSRLAESALPAAAELARRLGARVTLFHALELAAPATVHGERHLTQRPEADTYLRAASVWVSTSSVEADALVRHAGGDVAAAIAAAAQEAGAEIIVLTTHGHSGVRNLLFGRVAQQVLQQGSMPVLLVPPSPRGRERAFACRRVLVPLDGSEMAETALPAAVSIAAAFGAAVFLVLVVPTVETISGERAAATRLMPTAAAAVLDLEAAQGAAYLQATAARMAGRGVQIDTAVKRGDPTRALLDAAAPHDVDLIAMATHGHSGIAAVWAGSVASRIAAQSPRPILFIRIPAVRPPGSTTHSA